MMEDAAKEHDAAITTNPQSVELVKEAVEYVLLDQLALHLQSHFNESRYKADLVTQYSRKDIPHLLLQNRVLALLSSPYQERAVFADWRTDAKPGKTIVQAWGPGGEIYRPFELALPSHTKIRRTATGELQLDSPRLGILVGVDYERAVSNELSSSYIEMVLGRDPWGVQGHKITVTFSYTVKTLALLRTSGWEYYEWVDSFAERLREFLSIERYLECIQWPSVSLQSQIIAYIIVAMTHSTRGAGTISQSDQKESG
jgi:hypothetical protein